MLESESNRVFSQGWVTSEWWSGAWFVTRELGGLVQRRREEEEEEEEEEDITSGNWRSKHNSLSCEEGLVVARGECASTRVGSGPRL